MTSRSPLWSVMSSEYFIYQCLGDDMSRTLERIKSKQPHTALVHHTHISRQFFTFFVGFQTLFLLLLFETSRLDYSALWYLNCLNGFFNATIQYPLPAPRHHSSWQKWVADRLKQNWRISVSNCGHKRVNILYFSYNFSVKIKVLILKFQSFRAS